ncbi:BolA family transcriptional regulator [Sphingomonas sp. ID1715]|uniref:BolA family protein n=1 Tax=Sphingomonas sp. ID1715 TaxID=1656898 RepID=UPI0014889572|nr:BolA family protein [Sphingomonas sp. ID1715]NNM77341.1 BolA family transcriptional regulator [Sphingomonas sp. ID1715]
MDAKTKGPVAAEIEKRLIEALQPLRLEVVDDSEKHRGHAGHDSRGESHFSVLVVSQAFEGKSRVARQRMVNAALADLLAERVHALAMVTKAPSEI